MLRIWAEPQLRDSARIRPAEVCGAYGIVPGNRLLDGDMGEYSHRAHASIEIHNTTMLTALLDLCAGLNSRL